MIILECSLLLITEDAFVLVVTGPFANLLKILADYMKQANKVKK